MKHTYRFAWFEVLACVAAAPRSRNHRSAEFIPLRLPATPGREDVFTPPDSRPLKRNKFRAPKSSRAATRLTNCSVIAGLFLGLVLCPVARATTGAADSNVTTVDTRTGTLSVSGRVLVAASRAPLSGATVTLAGQNTSSSGAGLFSFASVSLSSGNTLAVSKTGYATYAGTVPAPAGATMVTVPDVLLVVSSANKPSVTGIRPKYDGLFLSGASIVNQYTASVDWNGKMPSAVEFYVNGSLTRTVSTSTTEATADLDLS